MYRSPNISLIHRYTVDNGIWVLRSLRNFNTTHIIMKKHLQFDTTIIVRLSLRRDIRRQMPGNN